MHFTSSHFCRIAFSTISFVLFSLYCATSHGQENEKDKEKTAEEKKIERLDLAQSMAIRDAKKWARLTGRYLVAIAANPKDDSHKKLFKAFQTGKSINELNPHTLTLKIDFTLGSFKTWENRYSSILSSDKTVKPTVYLIRPNGVRVNLYHLNEKIPQSIASHLYRVKTPKLDIEQAKLIEKKIPEIEKLVDSGKKLEALERLIPYTHLFPDYQSHREVLSTLIVKLEELYRKNSDNILQEIKELVEAESASSPAEWISRARVFVSYDQVYSRSKKTMIEQDEIRLLVTRIPQLRRRADELSLVAKTNGKDKLTFADAAKICAILKSDDYQNLDFANSKLETIRSRFGVENEQWHLHFCPSRQWMDKTGKFSVEASVIAVSKEYIRLQTSNGERLTVRVSDLGAADQKWFKENNRTID